MKTKTFVVLIFFVGVFSQNISSQTAGEAISKAEAEAFWQSFKTFCLYKEVSLIPQFITDTLWVYNQEDNQVAKEYFTAKQIKKDMRKSVKKTMELVPSWNGTMAVVNIDNGFTTRINVNEYAPELQPEYATRSIEFKENPECANEYVYSTIYRMNSYENSTIYFFKKIDGQIKLHKKLNKTVQ